MANDSTIGVGFLFITPSLVVLLLYMWVFGEGVFSWHSVCFQCVFSVFSWHRCVFCYVWWEVVGC